MQTRRQADVDLRVGQHGVEIRRDADTGIVLCHGLGARCIEVADRLDPEIFGKGGKARHMSRANPGADDRDRSGHACFAFIRAEIAMSIVRKVCACEAAVSVRSSTSATRRGK